MSVIISVLGVLTMLEIMTLIAMFTGYYFAKQVSDEVETVPSLRITNKVMFELKVIAITLLVIIGILLGALIISFFFGSSLVPQDIPPLKL